LDTCFIRIFKFLADKLFLLGLPRVFSVDDPKNKEFLESLRFFSITVPDSSGQNMKKIVGILKPEEIANFAEVKREKLRELLMLPENSSVTDQQIDEFVESSVRLVAGLPLFAELSVEQLQSYHNLASKDLEKVIKLATEKRKEMLNPMLHFEVNASPYHIFVRFEEKRENIFTRLRANF
jgi:hypothetical protein